jgi:protein-disulfide isomerase
LNKQAGDRFKLVADGGTPTASTQPTAQQPAPVTVTKEQIQGLFKQGMITFGKKDAKVVFVEFSDPSCPYCHIAAGKNGELNKQAGDRFKLVADGGTYVAPVEEMKKLVDQGKAAFVWAYSNGHGNGELGTKALYCAHEKGRFWQVHDKLMSKEGYDLINNTVKNDKAQSGTLAEFLKDAVDQNFLKSCLESGKYDGKIAEDQSLASSLGVNGTPGFFVNTTNYAGAYSYKDMEATVTAALK